jgi:ribosomal protein S18 acetylase RimI-like enzyme
MPGEGGRWRWARKGKTAGPEAFLRSREKFCVAAGSRFLRNHRGPQGLAYLAGPGEDISALLIHHHRVLFPVFSLGPLTPFSPSFRRFIRGFPVHAVQGLRGDVEALEALFAAEGCLPVDRIDYDLMALDKVPDQVPEAGGPPGLTFYRPAPSDMDELYHLQAAYEQEEVLPRGAVFDPLSCRLSLGRVINQEHVMAARLEGRLVGKINTNAASFTRYQIGGVYVRPEYRGRGIAARMTAAFLGELAPEGMGLSLFVKKNNLPAQRVYRRAGFETLGDYRICYY